MTTTSIFCIKFFATIPTIRVLCVGELTSTLTQQTNNSGHAPAFASFSASSSASAPAPAPAPTLVCYANPAPVPIPDFDSSSILCLFRYFANLLLIYLYQ